MPVLIFIANFVLHVFPQWSQVTALQLENPALFLVFLALDASPFRLPLLAAAKVGSAAVIIHTRSLESVAETQSKSGVTV